MVQNSPKIVQSMFYLMPDNPPCTKKTTFKLKLVNTKTKYKNNTVYIICAQIHEQFGVVEPP